MAKRTVEELQAYRDEFDALRMSSFALPEDWEVDLFSEDDRKENRKNELKRLAGLLGGENGREAVGGTHSSPEKSPSPLGSSSQNFSSPADSMGGTNSKPRRYRRNFGGFDGGFEMSFTGKWCKPQFDRLCEDLNEARADADNERTGFKIITLGDSKVGVKCTGAKCGVMYKYVLESGGLKIYIHSDHGVEPQIRVRYGFEALCKENLFDIYDRLIEWFSYIGFDVQDELISRIDIQVMTERPVSEYVFPILRNEWVCRARSDEAIFRDGRTGELLSFRKGRSVEFCIYDKRKEILSAHTDEVKYELFRREILDSGPLPDNLTRVEFRLSREYLNRNDINTMQDLKNNIKSIVHDLTHYWVRILDGPKKKNNESRQGVAECWKEIQDLFEYYFDFDRELESDPDYSPSSYEEYKAEKPAKIGKNIDNLVRQLCGCGATVAAYTLDKVNDAQDMLNFLTGLLEKNIVSIIDKFVYRRRHNEVVRGYTPLVLEADFSESETPWDCLDDSVMERVRKEYFKRLEENSTPF